MNLNALLQSNKKHLFVTLYYGIFFKVIGKRSC